jgi:hypothetical protein
MQVNQPSDETSVLAAGHQQESDPLLPPSSVTIAELDEQHYGSPIAPGITVFEVKNSGTEDASDVYAEIAVESSARMLSIEPSASIIASKAARVHLGTIQAGQSKLIKVYAASGNGKPVQFTTQVVLETEPQFVNDSSSSDGLPVNPFPRNPVPRASRSSAPKAFTPVAHKTVHPQNVLEQSDPRDVGTPKTTVADANASTQQHDDLTNAPTNQTGAPEEPIIIKIESPKQFVLGVPYRVYATIQNPSESAISNVQISVKSSGHLRSTREFASFQTIARLDSRHAARFEFEIFGVEPGNAELYIDATAKFEAEDGTELAEGASQLIRLGSSEIIEVYKPSIRARFKGPEFVHVGTEATYGIEVINESGNPLTSTDVLLNIPQGMVLTVLDRIAYKRSDTQILWRVENLEPGKSELIQYKAKAWQPGLQAQQVELSIQNQIFAENTFETEILGPSQLQVELQDPFAAIPIGEVAKLKINISNVDDYDNELQLKVSLPDSVHAVNSENLQSNERNEVLFKPTVVARKSDLHLEIPVVGSAIGGQTIQATVTSNTTFVSHTTSRVIVFVNPQDAYGRVTEMGPPANVESTNPAPILMELPDSAAAGALPIESERRAARTAHEYSSTMPTASRNSSSESHAPAPDQRPNSPDPASSLAPRGFPPAITSEPLLKRGLPARIRPLIVSRKKTLEEQVPSSTSPSEANSNRRQPGPAERTAMFSSSSEPLQTQPSSTSILINRR